MLYIYENIYIYERNIYMTYIYENIYMKNIYIYVFTEV